MSCLANIHTFVEIMPTKQTIDFFADVNSGRISISNSINFATSRQSSDFKSDLFLDAGDGKLAKVTIALKPKAKEGNNGV